MRKKDFDLMDYMSEILDNFYNKNGLESMCALDSQHCGNYKNQEQYKWLQRFSIVWEKLEDRYNKRNYYQYTRLKGMQMNKGNKSYLYTRGSVSGYSIVIENLTLEEEKIMWKIIRPIYLLFRKTRVLEEIYNESK